MRVSLRDVALQAGVSINTVSGVLNERDAARISQATREHVRRTADALGYHRNRLAGSLRSGKTATIGLILSELSNPFFLRILQTMETLAAQSGYQILLDAATGSGPTAKDTGKLRGWPVDGILLWTRQQHDIRTFIGPQADGLPVVYLGYEREDSGDVIAFDLEDGGRQATRHLMEKGCKRIAFVSPYPLGPWDPDPRYAAYADVCREAGREPELILIEKEIDSREAGLAAGIAIGQLAAQDRPDGLVCNNDLVAIGVYRGLRRAGIDVPGSIRLVGFDNIPDIQYMENPLTTVDAPIEEFCTAALNLLLARIGGDVALALEPPRRVLIPTRLIPGGSS